MGMKGDTGLEVQGLSFSYGPKQHRVEDIGFRIGAGEIGALLGPNGSGKTTILRCILGLLSASSGEVRVAGQDLTQLSARARARLVAYVPQSQSLAFPFTVLEVVVMGRTPHLAVSATPSQRDVAAAWAQMEAIGIAHLAERSFQQLSGGERQLTLIARALLQDAPVLVLDEPTAALDYGNELRILNVVSELAAGGRAVFMTTHSPDHALGRAQKVVLINNGRMEAFGPPDAVLTGSAMSRLYGLPVHLVEVELPDGTRVKTCLPAGFRLGSGTPIDQSHTDIAEVAR